MSKNRLHLSLLGSVFILIASTESSLASDNDGVRILSEKILTEDGLLEPQVIVKKHKKISSINKASLRAKAIQVAMIDDSSSKFNSNPVSDSTLSNTRGTFNPAQLGVATLDATTANNSSDNSITGFNQISSDALGNSKGVVSLIQNTGNNVIIQNATIVNLTMSK